MTLVGYLPTRTFELVVHGLDLAAAVGADVPAQLAGPLAGLSPAGRCAGGRPRRRRRRPARPHRPPCAAGRASASSDATSYARERVSVVTWSPRSTGSPTGSWSSGSPPGGCAWPSVPPSASGGGGRSSGCGPPPTSGGGWSEAGLADAPVAVDPGSSWRRPGGCGRPSTGWSARPWPGSREPTPTGTSSTSTPGDRPVAAQIGPDGGPLLWTGRDAVPAGLATVARDAVDLLTSGAVERVRECDAPDCALLFWDTSRPGRRRWCADGACGSRARSAAYRARRRRRPEPDRRTAIERAPRRGRDRDSARLGAGSAAGWR